MPARAPTSPTATGVLLATSLATASLFADARLVPNPEEAVKKLATVLPDIDRKVVDRAARNPAAASSGSSAT